MLLIGDGGQGSQPGRAVRLAGAFPETMVTDAKTPPRTAEGRPNRRAKTSASTTPARATRMTGMCSAACVPVDSGVTSARVGDIR